MISSKSKYGMTTVPLKTILLLSLGCLSAPAMAAPTALQDLTVKFFDTHCYECHDEDSNKGDLNLYQIKANIDSEEQVYQWSNIFKKIESGEMPPAKKERPDQVSKNKLLSALTPPLRKADKKYRQVVLRRLNRNEYENTMHDLLHIDAELASHLPEDASSHGFDNIGQALSVSTEQITTYLKTADIALDAAFASHKKPTTKTLHTKLKDKGRLTKNLGKLLRDDPDGVVMFSSDYSPTNFWAFMAKEPGRYKIKLRAKAVQSDKAIIMRIYAGDVIAGRREKYLVGHYSVAPGEQWTTIEFEDHFNLRDSVKVVPYRNGGHLKDAKTTSRPGILVGDAEIIEEDLEAD